MDQVSTEITNLPPLPPGAPTLAKALYPLLASLDDVIGMPADVRAAIANGAAVLRGLPAPATGREDIPGRGEMWIDPEGKLTPAALVKPERLLEDDFVRTVVGGALNISASLRKYKALTLGEAQGLLDNLAANYGGKPGNVDDGAAFYSYDRMYKIEVRAQKQVALTAEISTAKALLDEWLADAEASDEIKAVIQSAFGLGDQGSIRISELVRLKRYNITHPKWLAALDAIDNAMETVGKAVYVRVYQRGGDGKYALIPLDLAAV